MNIWTVDILLGALGLVLSLAQWLIPPFKKFQQSLGDWTPLFSVGVLLVLTIGALVTYCQFAWACMVISWPTFWQVFTSGVVTYYGSYHAFIKPAKTIKGLSAALDMHLTGVPIDVTQQRLIDISDANAAKAQPK